MSDSTQQEELLKQIRANIFSGMEITENNIKQYTGQLRTKGFKEKDAATMAQQAVEKAKMQMQPAQLPEVAFDNIRKLHESRSRILSLLDSQPDYLLNDMNGEQAFNRLSASFEKNSCDKDKIAVYIKYLEERAKKQENKDTRDRLFETVRDFAQWCKEFLLNPKYESLYPALAKNYGDIVTKISGAVSKTGIGITVYSNLAEECYDILRKKGGTEQEFKNILALINLRCTSLGVSVPTVNIVSACPKCGDKGQTGAICSKCGAYIRCPGCSSIVGKDAKICGGCGVEIDRIDTLLAQLKDADKKLSAGDYESAEALIAPIKVKWNKNEHVVSLVNGITGLRSKTSEQEGQIGISLSQGNYFAAQRSIEDVKRKSVLSEQLKAKEKDVQRIIEQAKALVGAGDKASAPTQKIDNYAQAVNLIADYDEAINKLKQQNLVLTNLRCDVNGRAVSLAWEKIIIPSVVVEYMVFRETPTGKGKEKVAQTSATTYSDTIDIGISYNYYIQVQFGVPGRKISVLSQDGIKSREIIAVDDVTVTKSIAGNRSVSMEFTVPQNVYEVKIIRSGNGTKEFKENYKSGKFSDTDVINDCTYTYKIVSSFKTQSLNIAESKGVNVTLTPAAPPSSVKLTKREEENFADISWPPPAKGVVVLYMCDEKQGFVDGEIIDIAKMRGTAVNSAGDGKTKISYSFHGIKYLYPVTKHNNICVVGEPVTIKSVRQVKDVSYERNERKIEVSWSWDGIDAVTVFSKADDNAESKQIISKKNTPIPQHTITIPQGAKSMAVGVASYFKTDKSEELLSDRVELRFGLQVAKVSFLSVTQGGLFSKNKFKLEIQTDAPLPCDLHLLIGEGMPPMDLKNYKSYLTISNKGLAENKPCEFSFEYSRNDKSKAMIFRLIPADLQAFKSISIVPETKQIK